MKKFLKVFIIVVLVLATVVGTCVLFFINRKKNNTTTSSIAEFLFAEENEKFNEKLANMDSWVDSDGTDNRVELILTTNLMLDEMAKDLSSYHIANGTKITNEKIFNAFKNVQSSKNLLVKMMDEYKIKKDSTYFNRHTGANDFYAQACVYLINYAKFNNYVNVNLNINRNVDLKFSVYEIYSNVVMNTFSKTKTLSSLVLVDNAQNLNKLHEIVSMDNSFIETNVNQFAIEITLFNNAYYETNKVNFANNLTQNISSVTTADQSSKEKLATYYFKQIFGI